MRFRGVVMKLSKFMVKIWPKNGPRRSAQKEKLLKEPKGVAFVKSI
jgi:hypothetical protein